jgi:hypothetical protein
MQAEIKGTPTMLQTLVLAAALNFGPAQSGLSLTNARVTFGGQFGPNRPDRRYLPGDLFFMVFDIDGLRADPQGRVEYAIGMIVKDAAGKVVLDTSNAEPTASLIPLGASKLPARAYLVIGPEMKGRYTCTIIVTDRKTNESKNVEQDFEVLPPDFGIVGFHMAYDIEGNIQAPQAPFQGVPGQILVMHFETFGFTRDQTTKQPNIQVEVRIFDEAGRPTTEQPQPFAVKQGVKEDYPWVGWHLPLPLTRVGTFTVEVKATDVLSSKVYKMAFKVKVTMPDVKG